MLRKVIFALLILVLVAGMFAPVMNRINASLAFEKPVATHPVAIAYLGDGQSSSGMVQPLVGWNRR